MSVPCCRWFGLMLLAIASPDPGLAQHPDDAFPRRSLVEVLEAAERSNPELLAARQRVDAARAARVSAGARPMTSLEAERIQLGGQRTYHETTIALSRPLDWNDQRGARTASADALVTAAGADLTAVRARMVAAVQAAYVRAAEAEARVTIRRESSGLVRDAAKAAARRAEEGDLSRYTADRLALEASRHDALLSEAELEARTAARALAALAPTAADGTSGVRTAEPLAVTLVDPGMARDSIEARLARHPIVAAADAELQAARARRTLQERATRVSPSLSIGFREQAVGQRGAIVAVGVPLRWGAQRNGPRAEADVAVVEAELARDHARLGVARTAADALDRHTVLTGRLAARETLLVRATAVRDAARVAYEEGEADLLEFLDAIDTHRRVREDADALLAAYLTSVADLVHALGGTAR
jgi:outer membrane protein TolC